MFQIRLKRLRRRSHQRIARELYFDIGARVRRLLVVLPGVAVAHTLAILWFEDIGVIGRGLAHADHAYGRRLW